MYGTYLMERLIDKAIHVRIPNSEMIVPYKLS